MSRSLPHSSPTLACLAIALTTVSAVAQSGTRSAVPSRQVYPSQSYQSPNFQSQPGTIQSAPIQGSTIRSAPPAPVAQGSTMRSNVQQGSTVRSVPMVTSAPVGLQGYCPVCIVNMKKWVKGNATYQASYDGKTYHFPGEEQRQMFLSDPAKYAPALGGDCAVCLTDMGKRMPGSIFHSALNENRLYLFPNADLKQKFVGNVNQYNHADLAENGNCVVCRVEMNKAMPGRPEVFLVHGGMRYQFASEDQKKMFLASPSKYAPTAAGSTSR